MSTARAAMARIASYREGPYGACRFVQEQFGVTPDPWQEKALIAFGDPAQQRISLQAAAGVGKSAVMAWCAWFFLATQALREGDYFHHPKGVVTGVTDQNLRDNFWAELSKYQSRSEWLKAAFTHSDKKLFANDHPGTWFLGRRNWPKSGSADEQGATLSGLHGRAVASFIDESGNIPPTVLRAGEQALADRPAFGKIMQAGNPISLEGMLYAAANQLRSQWTIIVVTNDPDDPMRSPRGDVEWAKQQIALYGRDNAWVRSYLLGQFPQASLNALLGIEEVTAAMQRHLTLDQYDWAQKRLGVDVARFGDDRSVIFARQGMNARVMANNPVVMRTASTTDIAARVAMATTRWGSELTLIDDTGHWGHGVLDNMVAAGFPAMGINFAGAALDKRYRNRRAEMWIAMADAIKAGAALPNIPDLVAELVTPTYTFVNGVFQLEEKDQIKKRLGRSPDLADALALTYSVPEMPGDMMARLGLGAVGVANGYGMGRAATDYRPAECV
jgi:phage terminase large subunit